jgi:hypothetical protein
MGSVKILLLLGLLAVGLQCGRPLKLYPNGALVPEETQEVVEARQLHEAAMEAAEERINGPHPPTTTRRPRSPSLVLPPAPPLVRRIAAGATGASPRRRPSQPGGVRPPSPVPRLPAPPSLVRQRGGGAATRPAARPRTPPAAGRGPPPPPPPPAPGAAPAA